MKPRPSGSKRTTASDRMARMLAMVPWIAANDGPTRAEISRRFDLDPKKLDEDLRVLEMVGVPPYTPDVLIEVAIDGDRVWLRFADVFARPLLLTPEQGLALVAAGQAARGILGDDAGGPLASALAKVAGVLGIEPDEAVAVALGETRPGVLDALRQAVSEHRRVRIDYYTYSRDERSIREVDPHEVFADEGAWYVGGHCHTARDRRLFRVDRIFGLELTEHRFDPPPERAEGTGVFEVGPEVPRMTLDLAPIAQWVAHTYPVEGDEMLDDGWRRVRLAVTSQLWLERVLVRLGPNVRVVDSDDPDLVVAGSVAARRMLERYRRRA